MIHEEYGIPLESGVEEEAKLNLNLHKKGYTAEQIADMTDKSMEEIMAILEQKELLLV